MPTFEELHTRYKNAGGVATCEYQHGIVYMTYQIGEKQLRYPTSFIAFKDLVENCEKR